VGVHTTPWLFTPSTQRQRSRALLTQRDRHPRAVPTARPEGRRATHASDPPHTLANTQGTNAALLDQCRQSQSSSHSVLSQQPLRLRAGGWATNGRLLRTPLRTRGAPTTRRAGADRALPPAGPPAQTRGTRDGLTPNRQLELAPPRRFDTNYVCMRGNRPAPAPPGGAHDPPLGSPESACIRAETSATSVERRRTRPTI